MKKIKNEEEEKKGELKRLHTELYLDVISKEIEPVKSVHF
jgi:hypothetical protein